MVNNKYIAIRMALHMYGSNILVVSCLVLFYYDAEDAWLTSE